MKHYDVIVIGSGAGSKITRPAANLGNKVAIIEQGRLGGTCLNHGCIPSKMLIHPADVLSELREAHKFDLAINQTVHVDFEKLVSRVSKTIDTDSDSIEPLYDKNPNIDLYKSSAKFVSDKVIDLGSEQITAERIFIAAGARAQLPNIQGLDQTPYMTYKEALRLTKQPKKMIVVGAGYIACELGYYFAMLGTEVTFLVRSRFLKQEDEEVSAQFQDVFSSKFDVRLGAVPEAVEYNNGEFSLKYNDIQTGESHNIEADSLFIATGVQPNTDTLALHNTAIQTDDKGYITVDDHLQTTVPGVYAFGDILGRHLFRHTANYEGEYVFQSVFGNKNGPIQYPPVPHAVFSHPQIAGVGLTEQECKKLGIDVVVGKNDYKDSAMGMALLSDHGFCKLIFEKSTKKLIGAHIIGEQASTMIHMPIAYMKMKATLDDMLDTIYIHPALPEIVRNAARKAKANV